MQDPEKAVGGNGGNMKIKGAIFDADGTLLNSMQIWDELGERYLTDRGITPEAGLTEILYPMSLDESSQYLKEHYGLCDSVEKITADTVMMLRDFYLSEVTLKEGVYDFLQQLKKEKIPMIIATSNDKELLQKVFCRLNIAEFFSRILTCGELNVNKREPAIYLEAAKIMGTEPKNTAVFEDLYVGILSAKSAGFVTVAVKDDSNVNDCDMLFKTADHFISDFTDSCLKNI